MNHDYMITEKLMFLRKLCYCQGLRPVVWVVHGNSLFFITKQYRLKIATQIYYYQTNLNKIQNLFVQKNNLFAPQVVSPIHPLPYFAPKPVKQFSIIRHKSLFAPKLFKNSINSVSSLSGGSNILYLYNHLYLYLYFR